MSSKKLREEIVNYGRSVIQTEAKVLEHLSSVIDDSFYAAVSLILGSADNGHVIVSGMGKAGFVGMKISATLASTGIPSFFLHPAEALHGDLGRYRKTDIALLVSNSGETEEIIRTISQVKRIGCPVIAITASQDSTIGKHSDVVIEIGAIEEACPLGLAPTASTTAMLCIGDALAMAILKQQSFTPEQFAAFHPAGKLGRQLLQVSEIMRSGNAMCIVSEATSVRETLGLISETEGRPGAAAIIAEDGSLSGIFTDGDLRRCLAAKEDFLKLAISQCMSTNPKTVSDTALVAEAMTVLSAHKIDQVIIVDDANKPVGLIDVQDLFAVKALSQS